MSDRRSSHRHRSTFEERCRVVENELKRKNETNETSRNDYATTHHQSNDLSRTSYTPTDQSFLQNTSRRTSATSNWSILTKDREIAKLKALLFEKDNEMIALSSTHKKTLLQVEDRMERERKAWSEHKQLLLAGERAKFEEENSRLIKDLKKQLEIQQDRCEELEKKFHDAQMQMSEAKLLLKESGRERINTIYSIKEQCRKEFQDEIARLRNQFQMEKNSDFSRTQHRVKELEETLDQISTENADHAVHQHELFCKMEAAEKTCVRTIVESIKKLLMAMESPSHLFATIPNASSFTYDRDSIIERLPTRSVLKLLQDSVDELQKFLLDQRVQSETKAKLLKKSNVVKQKKESIERLPMNNSQTRLQLSTEQNDTIDNLVEKLENHIANELDRLTKQRITMNNSTSHQVEQPKKVKFESRKTNFNDEINQDSLIRHLQNRISDLRDDNIRLRSDQNEDSFRSRHRSKPQ